MVMLRVQRLQMRTNGFLEVVSSAVVLLHRQDDGAQTIETARFAENEKNLNQSRTRCATRKCHSRRLGNILNRQSLLREPIVHTLIEIGFDPTRFTFEQLRERAKIRSSSGCEKL